MPDVYSMKPSTDDDHRLNQNFYQSRGTCPENADTSFEIDEPDDEEEEEEAVVVVAAAIEPATNKDDDDDDDDTETETEAEADAVIGSGKPLLLIAASRGNRRQQQQPPPPPAEIPDSGRGYAVSLVCIEDSLSDDYDLSDGTESAGGSSSTPTTADVADFSSGPCSVIAPMVTAMGHRVKRLSPLQRIKYQGGGGIGGGGDQLHPQQQKFSGGDDNLSVSIATTTTDIDLGGPSSGAGSASISPNVTAKRSYDAASAAAAAAAQSSSMHPQPHAILEQTDTIMHKNTKTPCPNCPNHHHHHHNHNHHNHNHNHCNHHCNHHHHRRTHSASSYFSIASQSVPSVQAIQGKANIYCNWLKGLCGYFKNSGIGEPSVYHALVVIFLEFFAWGLLTVPLISVLNQTFPEHTFLMNGIVMGIKGILSFLSAPLIGALSDIWGRKFFLLITVFFTCAPIPLMTINTFWFFAMISISGVFAVTFSVVFAYVADVTTVEERSRSYGLVSATFAASMVISPALGAALLENYGDTMVVALATAIAVLDVFFILVAVPESLPEKIRPASWGAPISWEQADPFAALRKVGTDHTILMQCVTVLLSYLPEAGEYSCIFVYLKLKMGFNSMRVSVFIAVVGILSIAIQVTLGYLMRVFGAKRTIILGLILEMMQMCWFGFGSEQWMMWAAGILAALGSITYPAISAYVSLHSTADRQGAVQGMVTGMRGLCNGLGPAMFGVIFYFFNVDLNGSLLDRANKNYQHGQHHVNVTSGSGSEKYASIVPGPPFAFGAVMVILAIMVAVFMPDARGELILTRSPSEKKRGSLEIEHGHKALGPLAPLMRSDSLAQL